MNIRRSLFRPRSYLSGLAIFAFSAPDQEPGTEKERQEDAPHPKPAPHHQDKDSEYQVHCDKQQKQQIDGIYQALAAPITNIHRPLIVLRG
jgi:hypothetical protein